MLMSCDTLCVCPETRHCPRYQCPRYQRKWPPETSPGAIFMPDGNTFGNIRNANEFLGTDWEDFGTITV